MGKSIKIITAPPLPLQKTLTASAIALSAFVGAGVLASPAYAQTVRVTTHNADESHAADFSIDGVPCGPRLPRGVPAPVTPRRAGIPCT